jgi:hypothetical protein
MSDGRNISGPLALLLSSDFLICVNFQENTAEANILNMSFHSFHLTHYVVSIL